MSILVQPKLLPLEGDSSMKVHRGKWWVKDSSAIHVVPAVTIVRLHRSPDLVGSQDLRIDLLVSNPSDQPVTVELRAGSIECGEAKELGERAPFACTTVVLEPCPSEQEPPVTVSLAAYEDELLRESDDGDGGLALAREIKRLRAESSRSDLWHSAVSLHSARISVPLKAVGTESGAALIQVPLTMRVSSGSMTHLHLLRVVFPLTSLP
jgi:hypothetical protein